jgi:cation diffusion facilitator CzcD-associated flavoprotein CzcO
MEPLRADTGPDIDVPSHSYQLSFESYPGWSQFFSGAPEILEYWKTIVEKYDIRKRVRFEHKCIGARWSESASKWFVQIRDLKTDMTFEDEADVLMTGEGVLNEWAWPNIPGIHDFQGTLLHSANWKKDFDAKVSK